MRKLTKSQQDMYDALVYLASQPDMFRPGINLHGAGQYATAKALARKGLGEYFPIGRIEPSRDMYAMASVLDSSERNAL